MTVIAQVIRQKHVPQLLAGNPENDDRGFYVAAVGRWLKRLEQADPPSLCALCPNEIRHRGQAKAIVIADFTVDGERMATASGICAVCGQQSDRTIGRKFGPAWAAAMGMSDCQFRDISSETGRG